MRLLLLIGALALALGTTAGLVLRPAAPRGRIRTPSAAPTETPVASPAANGHAVWTLLWTRPTPDLVDLALADNGATVAWVDANGSVRRMAADGKTLWQSAKIAGLNRLQAAATGDIFAYSYCNPGQPSIHLFPASAPSTTAIGEPRVVAYPVEGAVWTVATCVDKAGHGVAAVGTGRSLLYLLPFGTPTDVPAASVADAAARKASPQQSAAKVAVPGIPMSLSPISGDAGPAPTRMTVLAGMRQTDGMGAWTAAGRPLWPPWLAPQMPDRDMDVQLSEDGSVAVAICARRPRGTDARLLIWDGRSGQLIRREDLDGDDAHALVSTQGNFIAVTYRSRAAADPAVSRRIALFDRKGIRRFTDMGGRFFAPRLAALSVSGGHARVTVRDGDGFLMTIDDQHHYRSRQPLPADGQTGAPPTIQRTLTTRDGAYLLLQRGDGQISLYKARPS